MYRHRQHADPVPVAWPNLHPNHKAELKLFFNVTVSTATLSRCRRRPSSRISIAPPARRQKEMAEEEGLWPVLKWIKRLIDRVLIEDFGESELEFVWGDDAQIDAEQRRRILIGYVNAGILTRNEARARLGEEP